MKSVVSSSYMPQKYFIQNFKIIFFSVMLVFGALFFLNNYLSAEASTTDNLSGYAWSDTIGWISMNCTDPATCGGSNYGVTVAKDGSLSGFAWSEHIGWISFNPGDVGGCPNGTCAPRINRATGAVQGWARALGGGTANSGGWDGYISLSGANYGVSVTGCDWNGYAWGSDVVGWVTFDGHANDVLGTGHACQANLKSESISLRSGSMTQGSTVTFNASVKNESLIPLRFVDTFTYKYDSDINSTIVSSVSYLTTPLGADQNASEISGSFVVSKSGPLTVSHCVDDGDRIAETNENDNCSTYNVTVKGGNISAPDCTIPPGGSDCVSTITWTSDELIAPSIKKNGVQWDPAPDNIVGRAESLTLGTYTYSMHDGAILIASDQAQASCASGSSWDALTNSCTGAPPAAPAITFVGPASVPEGTPGLLVWTVTGTADGCWATNDGGVANWNNEWVSVVGGNRSVIPTIDPTHFYLECWNKGITSGKKEVTIAITPPDTTKTANITASACTIPSGGNTCNTLVSWSSANLVNPSIQQDNNEFSDQPNSPTGGQTRPVTISPQAIIPATTFSVEDGAFTESFSITPTCAAPATWNGTTCAGAVTPGLTPTLRADPRIVDEGEDTTLTWFTNGTPETNCILKGGAFGSAGITVPNDTFNPAIDRGSILTPVYANTTYSISCPANAVANVNVEIIPRYFPS